MMKSKIEIRKAKYSDLDALLGVYQKAREIMRNTGNPTQWSGGYPQRELLEEDVLSNNNIVALHNALEFDLPKSIKETGIKYSLTEVEINEIYNPIAMLWEYNRNNLGRDLEI